ncbi:MAG: glycosyltransferase family 4 protein [Propionibacteriaceae bacterium]|nr:glycosyltransferase family 4 protein [Propionibacteriaceae bacterium]
MPQKQRILVVGQHYWPETFRVTDLCEGLVERGYDVDVLCGMPNYPSGTLFPGYSLFGPRVQHHNGVRIFRAFEVPRGDCSNFRIALNFVSWPLAALNWIPFLLTQKYDRILCYQLSPVFMTVPAIILARLKRLPLTMIVCDFWPHSLLSIFPVKNRAALRVMTAMSYWFYRRADKVVGVFKGIQDRMISEVGLPRDRTLYVPQWAELLYERDDRDPDLEARFGDRFNIVFAGNINPAQSFETVISAAKLAVASCPNLNFIIIGDGMSKNWLVDAVNANGLQDHFTFEGLKPTDDIPKWQNLADALIVCLSKSDLFEYGIPAKVYSYLAGGRPIIGAMDGEGKRLINEYAQAGYCVDSEDAEGLAQVIQRLYHMDPAQREALGQNGRRYHQRHFEREQNLDRLENFLFDRQRIVDSEYPDN